MREFGGAGIDRRAGQHQLGDLLGEAGGIGGGEPTALAQSDQRGAPAEIVDGDVQIAEIGVDAEVAHPHGRRPPKGQGEAIRSPFGENLCDAVAFGEIGDRGLMNRVGRDDQRRRGPRRRRLALLEEQHRRELDANPAEQREGGEVDRGSRPLGQGGAHRKGVGEALQSMRGRGRPYQAPQFERVGHRHSTPVSPPGHKHIHPAELRRPCGRPRPVDDAFCRTAAGRTMPTGRRRRNAASRSSRCQKKRRDRAQRRRRGGTKGGELRAASEAQFR